MTKQNRGYTTIMMTDDTRRKIQDLIDAGITTSITSTILLAVDRLHQNEIVKPIRPNAKKEKPIPWAVVFDRGKDEGKKK